MRKVIFALVMAFVVQGAMAQSVKLEWANHNVGNGTASAKAIAISDSGHVYVVGYFTDTVDFDPGPDTFALTSAGGKDIFVQKLDANGAFLWAKRIGGSAEDVPYAIAVDHLGNAHITGSFIGTVDFNPGTGTNNLVSASSSMDAFVLKLTAAGNYAWAYKLGSTNTDIGRGIAVDAAGAVYVTGSFIGTVNFNPSGAAVNLTSLTTNFSDFFVQKMNSAGAHQWSKRVGGVGIDVAYAIALDVQGNIYTAGHFSEVVDFDPNAGTDSLFARPSRDVFIHKLTNAGNYVWTRQLDGSLFISQPTALTLDNAKNIYLTGQFASSVDFDPGIDTALLTSLGGTDPFVLKLDSTGSYKWAAQFGGVASNVGMAVAVDADGSVYSTGYFAAQVDFDPGPDNYLLNTANLSTDIYLNKLDSLGQMLWTKSIASAGNNRGEAIALDTSGNVYFAGSFCQTTDFDPTIGVSNLAGVDSINAFVAKWSPCTPDVSAETVTVCYSYTANNGTTYTASTVFQEAYVNAFGCDSLVTVTLTIIDTARQIIVASACDSYELNGETYDTTGVYTQLFTSTTGCDSILTLELTISPYPTAQASQANDSLIADAVAGATYQWLDCNNNNAPIDSATNRLFVATGTGEYAVVVSSNGCSDTSACYSVVINNIAEDFGTRFVLYPNPTNGEITVNFEDSYGQVDIWITDMAGKMVLKTTQATTDMASFHLDAPAGLYLVTIATPNGEQRVLRLVNE